MGDFLETPAAWPGDGPPGRTVGAESPTVVSGVNPRFFRVKDKVWKKYVPEVVRMYLIDSSISQIARDQFWSAVQQWYGSYEVEALAEQVAAGDIAPCDVGHM